MPYLPLLELLRDIFEIEDPDSDHEVRRKITGELMLLDNEFHSVLPLLFEFLGVPDASRPAPTMSPEGRQRQLFGFIRHLQQARSEREPTVILLDDLHGIDPGSDEFLAHAVDAAQGHRTLMLVNFRPEPELAEALMALVGGEFLVEHSLYPEAECAFKHPITQEVAYRSLLSDRRERLHADVARAIEAADAERLDEGAALLAYHWENAGEQLVAATWHARAARWRALTAHRWRCGIGPGCGTSWRRRPKATLRPRFFSRPRRCSFSSACVRA